MKVHSYTIEAAIKEQAKCYSARACLRMGSASNTDVIRSLLQFKIQQLRVGLGHPRPREIIKTFCVPLFRVSLEGVWVFS